MKQDKETKDCTFIPKTNKTRRAKTHRAKEAKEQESTGKKVD